MEAMRRTKRRFIHLALLLSVLLTGSGCALLNGMTQNVSVKANVPDADVLIDGHKVGTTHLSKPTVVVLRRSENHVVIGRKEGYTSKCVTVSQKLSPLVVLDAIGVWLFLLPGISIVTGCAMNLEPASVYLKLESVPVPAVPTTMSSAITPTSAEASSPKGAAIGSEELAAPP